MHSASCTIIVACAANAKYALPLTVMLRSLGVSADPEIRIQAYIADDGISPCDKFRIAASLPDNVSLHWRPPVPLREGLPIWGRMSLTTYQKLTLGEWLPATASRAIWLDCDLIALRDISSLWRTEFAGQTILASQDERVPLVSSRFGVAAWRQLGLPPRSKYFNAGVMVIDLVRWRQYEVGTRSLNYLMANPRSVYFWDQEALNAILAGSWGELDPKWNRHPSLEQLQGRKGKDAKAGRNDPWIVHFSGSLKPWVVRPGGRWGVAYDSLLQQTQWARPRQTPTWKEEVIHWYATSRLRRMLYPIEQFSTPTVRALTRR